MYLRYLTRITYIQQADTDICADPLGFSAQYRVDFPHNTTWKNLDRNSARIHAKNRESKSLVKLSQFCYAFKDICTYTKSSEGAKVTVKAVQQSTVALRALTTFISCGK